MGNAVTRVTVDPTLNNSGATLEFLNENSGTLPDADSRTTGHQVDIAVGVTTVKAKVTFGGNSLTYTLAVERDSNEDWGWTPTRDFNHLTAGNIYIRGMWGNETTLYVSHLVDRKSTPTTGLTEVATPARTSLWTAKTGTREASGRTGPRFGCWT